MTRIFQHFSLRLNRHSDSMWSLGRATCTRLWNWPRKLLVLI